MPRVHSNKFVLINLEGEDSFVFDLFPTSIQTTDRANWEPQDTSIGTKPIYYANEEPRRISVPEARLDGSRTNESINDQIAALSALKNEIARLSRPPALLCVWGSEQNRCVLEEVTIDRNFFSPVGDSQRARVSLQLLELQEQRESFQITIKEVDDIDPRRDIGG